MLSLLGISLTECRRWPFETVSPPHPTSRPSLSLLPSHPLPPPKSPPLARCNAHLAVTAPRPGHLTPPRGRPGRVVRRVRPADRLPAAVLTFASRAARSGADFRLLALVLVRVLGCRRAALGARRACMQHPHPKFTACCFSTSPSPPHHFPPPRSLQCMRRSRPRITPGVSCLHMGG